MSNTALQVAESYIIEGINNKNLSKVPLDPNVIFQGPLQEKGAPLRGVDALQEFFNGIYSIVAGARIKKRVASGDEVCLMWELETSDSLTIPILEYFRVSDGRIAEIHPFYDPRPLVRGT